MVAASFMVFSAFISLVLCVPMHRLLVRWNVIDRPNERSNHTIPTARGLGVAIILAIVIVVATGMVAGLLVTDRVLFVCLGAMVFLACISFIDDLRSMSALFRFCCHLLAAIAIVVSIGLNDFHLSLAPEWRVSLPVGAAAGLTILWVAGYTNAFNFMDGINGIAAGQATLGGLGMALLAGTASGNWHSTPLLLSLAVSGAALGFLPHNFPRARMFMGDVGSAALGFILAVLALWLARDIGWWLLIPLVFVHANFVLDTAITLARRVIRGERWYDAHREHFYQRFVLSGKSHTWVTLHVMGLQLLVVAALILYLQVGAVARLLLLGAIISVWIGFFCWAGASLSKSQLPKE